MLHHKIDAEMPGLETAVAQALPDVEPPSRNHPASPTITPIIDKDAWHADAQWALQQWESNRFDASQGEYAAVYLKDILGYGNDPNELRQKWAAIKSVPFQRIITKYIGDEECI